MELGEQVFWAHYDEFVQIIKSLLTNIINFGKFEK